MRPVGGVSLGLLGLFAACGQLDTTSDGGVDGAVDSGVTVDQQVDVSADNTVEVDSAPDGAQVDASDAGACVYAKPAVYYCNGLEPAGPVNVSCSAQTPASGGAISDGLYELTAAVVDTATFDGNCPASLTRAGALEVCGDNFLWLDIDENNSAYDGSMAYSTNGHQLTLNPYCSGSAATYDYTATTTTIQIRVGGGAVFVLTYTLKSSDN